MIVLGVLNLADTSSLSYTTSSYSTTLATTNLCRVVVSTVQCRETASEDAMQVGATVPSLPANENPCGQSIAIDKPSTHRLVIGKSLWTSVNSVRVSAIRFAFVGATEKP